MVEIRNIKIGEGQPKICMPVVDTTDCDIIKTIRDTKSLPYDLIELRIDCYENLNDDEKVLGLLKQIRKNVDCPILFTCRSISEGGKSALSEEQYINLMMKVIDSQCVDLIDVEINKSLKAIYSLVEYAHQFHHNVVMSYHDFEKTPKMEDMVEILEKMEVMGADILKIAVMPLAKKDVVTLMDVSLLMSGKLDKPLVMISMGELGKITRVAGELIGSCITFASATRSSAPGQIQVSEMKKLLESIHG